MADKHTGFRRLDLLKSAKIKVYIPLQIGLIVIMVLLTPAPDVVIRSFTLDDLTELCELVKANRAFLREWLPWADRISDPRDEAPYIEMAMDKESRGEGFEGGIYVRGILAGSIGLHYISEDTRSTEIGYWLAEQYTGSGVMTACARTVLAYCFTEYKLNRVEIRAAGANLKSRAIPERLGFRLEGLLRQFHTLHGKLHDLAIYGMLAHEWKG